MRISSLITSVLLLSLAVSSPAQGAKFTVNVTKGAQPPDLVLTLKPPGPIFVGDTLNVFNNSGGTINVSATYKGTGNILINEEAVDDGTRSSNPELSKGGVVNVCASKKPDGDDVCIETPISVKDIPTVSEWGMMVMGLLLFTVATIVIRRSRRAAAA